MNKKGFTLIELLVVVGILAVLAVAALIAINPLEAQRRSRDAARLQDMARLSGVLEAYINDNGTLGLPAAAVNTQAAGVVRSQPCGGGHWLDGNGATAGPDFCPYIKQIPVDPQNTRTINALSGAGTAADPTRADALGGYGFIWAAASGDYELCTRLESDKNFEILAGDGDTGNAANLALFSTGTNLALACAVN